MQRITPYLLYEDVARARAFLESAFGFHERSQPIAEGHHRHGHIEMELDGSHIMMSQPNTGYQSPSRSGHACAMVHVAVDDVDAHYARSNAAGATIVEELEDRHYGDRGYSAVDPEGQRWWFVSAPTNGAANRI